VSIAIGIAWLSGSACPQVQSYYNTVFCDPYDANYDIANCAADDDYYTDYDCAAWTEPPTSDSSLWDNADFMCYTCVAYNIAGGISLAVGLALELPLLILCIVGACFKRPPTSSGVEMGAA